MAENQEYEMGNGEFEQDGGDQKFQTDEQMNGEGDGGNETGGGGDAPADSGSAEAPGRDDDRKLFVGGLSWETTDKELREHFQTYGDIESINVKTDPNTGRSRGFAFIVFSSAESIDKVLSAGDHIINNKKVDPKKAKARHGKIFVGGLVPELSDDDIKNFFAQYGTIVDVEMPFDKTKNQRKGFCFITFESEQVVQELLKSPKQSINGKEVDVKKATPKPDGMGGMRGGRGARGGRGRGRGGRGTRGGGYGGQGWGNQGGYGGYGGYDQDYGGYGNSYDGGYSGGRGGGRGPGPRSHSAAQSALAPGTMQATLLSVLALSLCGLARAGVLLHVPACPEPHGVQTYPHPELCDHFFLCTNGTVTLEQCENGLLYDGKGAVHNHCNYNWAVDCGARKADLTPISSPGCLYQFGIYPDSPSCSSTYIKCAHGEPHQEACDAGLVYDDKIHGCQWPDMLLEQCNPEAVIGFKCPDKVPSNSVAAKFWPYPRFAIPGDCGRLITCVNGYPRLITCGEGKVFDESSLTCEEPELVPKCANHLKK